VSNVNVGWKLLVELSTSVLFVDDSMTDRTRGIGLIRKSYPSWEVTPARSVNAALDELAEHRFDVVVSDLVMPGLDGRALLKIMADDYPLIPVVLITSQGDDQVAAECIALGAVNYVPKRKLAERLCKVLKEVVQAAHERQITRRVLEHVVQNRCRFEIDSDLNQIRALVNRVRDRLTAMQMFSARKVKNLTTALREALLNAHFHGNMQVNSRLLETDRHDYVAAAADRKNDATFTDRSIRMTMLLEYGTVTFRIEDDGPGFDPSAFAELMDDRHGQRAEERGLRKMATLMDRVEFNATGNEVTLTDIVEDLSV